MKKKKLFLGLLAIGAIATLASCKAPVLAPQESGDNVPSQSSSAMPSATSSTMVTPGTSSATAPTGTSSANTPTGTSSANTPASTSSRPSTPAGTSSANTPASTSSRPSTPTGTSSAPALPQEETNGTVSTVNLLSQAGDQESVYATWESDGDVESYNVYCKETSSGTYTKIDNELVRKYYSSTEGVYTYRADMVGLKAGSYKLKVVPVVGGNELADKAVETNSLTAVAYERTGFTFSTIASNGGKAPGAYNMDGTLKQNAQVVYVTEANKNTVELTIAGTKYTGLANITQNLKKSTTPVAFRIVGLVDYRGTTCSDLAKWYCLGAKTASCGITFEGIGNDAVMYHGGIGVNDCKSVEIRNLGFIDWGSDNADSDAIQLQGSECVWVHDNDIFYGHKHAGDQKKGDGSCDLKDDSKYVTVSYNHFWDSGKMSLCGMKSESGENYISYHHNWFDHSDSRHPRVRTMTVHVYNNFYDGNSKYGVGLVKGAQAFVEGNYIKDSKYPFLIGGYGSDATFSKSVFSGETQGFIKAYNNKFDGTPTRLCYANSGVGVAGATVAANATSSDAYLASSRNEEVASTYTNGVAYSNFDTKIDLGVTAEQVQSPDDAVVTVKQYAGRVGGGDFTYTFGATDYSNDDIDEALSAKLQAYKSDLIYVQGIGEIPAPGQSNPSTEPEIPVVEGVTSEEVIALIDALPDSSSVTAADRTAILTAKASYDSLTEEGQNEVTNYSKLEACITALNNLPQAAQVLTFPANNSFFQVTGDISTSKGTETYNGQTYSTCLKVASSTTITFTTTQQATLTIVLDKDENQNIKVDGNDKNATNGIVTVTIEAGEHTISKKDSTNIFYVSVE